MSNIEISQIISAVNQVHSQLNICHVAEKYFELKPFGSMYKAHCIHGSDSTPSLVFYPDQNKSYCYGCEKACNNIIEFVQWIEDCDFKEACNILIEKFNVTLNLKTDARLDEINKRIYKCHKVLLANEEKLQYLFDRGYTKESIEKFKLGLYQGSIVYPIADEYGTFVGKALRQFNKNPKYINDKASDFFKKKSILFGFNYIKKIAKQIHKIVIVEGYNDALILQQFNVPAVSLMGTALSQDHVDLLKRYNVEQVILFLDGDEAGIKATNNASRLLYSNNIATYVVNIKNKDPDEVAVIWKNKTFEEINKRKILWYKYQINIIKEKYLDKIYNIRLGFKDEIKQMANNLECPEAIAELLKLEKDLLQ